MMNKDISYNLLDCQQRKNPHNAGSSLDNKWRVLSRDPALSRALDSMNLKTQTAERHQEDNQSDPKDKQFDPKDKQFDPKDKQFDPKDKQSDPKGKQFDPKGKQFDPKDKQSDPKKNQSEDAVQEFFLTASPSIWAGICSKLSRDDCRRLAQTNTNTRQSVSNYMFSSDIIKHRNMSPSCPEALVYRETWIIELIINKSMKDIQNIKACNLSILSKNRSAQIRDILPNHAYLVEPLISHVSEISVPMISNKEICVSSLIKNQMSFAELMAITEYYSRENIQLNWVSDPESSDMQPYFNSPIISYVVQNTLLKSNAPIKCIGSYDCDGSRIDRVNNALIRQNHYESIGYNGKLHVLVNENTQYLKVCIPQINGSQSFSCEIHAHQNDIKQLSTSMI